MSGTILTGVVSDSSDVIMQPARYVCKCETEMDVRYGSPPPYCADCGKTSLKSVCFRTVQTFILRNNVYQKLCILTGSDCGSLRPNQVAALDVNPEILRIAERSTWESGWKLGDAPRQVTAYAVAKIMSGTVSKITDLERMSKDDLAHARLAGSFAGDYPAKQPEKEALVLLLLACAGSENPINILLLGSDRAAKMSLVGAVYELAQHKTYVNDSASNVMSANDGVVVTELERYYNIGLEQLVQGRVFERDRIPLAVHVSILAHATPKRGAYDASRPIHENVDIERILLDTFDLVCVIKDDMHSDSEPSDVPDGVRNLDLLNMQSCRDYLNFVANLEVCLDAECIECIKKHYMQSQKTTNPLKLNNLEALKKLTLAKARVHYRPAATERDAVYAARLFEYICSGHVTRVSHGVGRS